MDKRPYDLKLIDLLSLRPGSMLQLHAIRGEAGCDQAEIIAHRSNWQNEVSQACFPDGDEMKIHNMTKLLDIPIETQVVIRHDDGKVLEILRLEPRTWNALLERSGSRAEIMVDGRFIARGQIINQDGQSGILIEEMLGGAFDSSAPAPDVSF